VRNLLILGSGRSGTSMAAGLFRESGAYMGENSYAPRPSNRFGFFEDAQINLLNDAILRHMMRRGWRRFTWRLAPPIHRYRQALWLAAPRKVVAVDIAPEVREAMRKHTSREPFCLKDPRFGLTLPTWRPELPDGTRFLVVFRDPDKTVDSQLREARELAAPLPLTASWAYTSWFRMYRRLLDELSREGEWLFVRYEQIASGVALDALEAFAEIGLCASQIQPDVSRALARADRSPFARRSRLLFERLIDRADRDVAAWSSRD
jgi:hypothetical protein